MNTHQAIRYTLTSYGIDADILLSHLIFWYMHIYFFLYMSLPPMHRNGHIHGHYIGVLSTDGYRYMVLISKSFVIFRKLKVFNQNNFNGVYAQYYSYIEVVFIFDR
jgi:hypothetical protein